MTNLSPAAQAVLNAAFAQDHRHDHPSLAAALRAAADESSPDWMGLTVIHHLYALADELEGH